MKTFVFLRDVKAPPPPRGQNGGGSGERTLANVSITKGHTRKIKINSRGEGDRDMTTGTLVREACITVMQKFDRVSLSLSLHYIDK